MATTVTTKGQVTIPKRVREYLGMGPDMAVAFSVGADGEVVLKRAGGGEAPVSRFERAGYAGPGLSTDEIMRLLRPDD